MFFQATEDDHPDKQPLIKSINAMTDVAAAINEYKRRKDLGLSTHIWSAYLHGPVHCTKIY